MPNPGTSSLTRVWGRDFTFLQFLGKNSFLQFWEKIAILILL